MDEINKELNNIVEDIHKYRLENLDSKKIKKIKYEILKKITEDKDELIHYYKLLNNYRYIDEVDEFRLGSYIRFFNLKIDSLQLMRGGFICDLKPTTNDILIVCKNRNKYFNLRMNECIIFQKNTPQEQVLIEIIEHLK